jgi:hypothetical protein
VGLSRFRRPATQRGVAVSNQKQESEVAKLEVGLSSSSRGWIGVRHGIRDTLESPPSE